jgi:hypothetical protein
MCFVLTWRRSGRGWDLEAAGLTGGSAIACD